MAGKKGTGGAPSHKDPACPCAACTRRRANEAIALAAGTGGDALAPAPVETPATLNADAPFQVTYRSVARERIEQWLRLRLKNPDITNSEAARQMGVGRSALQGHIARAVREGWLQFTEPVSRIEHEVIPKAVDNLSELLDQKDKTATLETVKNTVFKQYLESKGVHEMPTTILALKIESAPEGATDVQVLTGQIVGAPRSIEKTE